MTILVKFIEVISDHHQGGSGKIFERQSLMNIDNSIMADQIFNHVETRLRDHSPVIYDVNDKQLIRVNSIEIFK